MLNQLRDQYRKMRFFVRNAREFLDLDVESKHYITTAYDSSVPLPLSVDADLSPDHPELIALRERYAKLQLPVCQHGQWNEAWVNIVSKRFQYFRGDSPYLWHYREMPKVTRLKYFAYLEYVRQRDQLGLLSSLDEDGAFGCWTFGYPERPLVSRDLLDSVNEINFLERALTISSRKRLRILDVGAGYGRLAHRVLTAFSHVESYYCVDAIPESSFLCSYYLKYRGLEHRSNVVGLDEFEEAITPGSIDLAFNIHSFSECTKAAVEWWVEQLVRLDVKQLFLVPNEPEGFLTTEKDGARIDFLPLLRAAGYEVLEEQNVIADPAVRELTDIHDRFYLFGR